MPASNPAEHRSSRHRVVITTAKGVNGNAHKTLANLKRPALCFYRMGGSRDAAERFQRDGEAYRRGAKVYDFHPLTELGQASVHLRYTPNTYYLSGSTFSKRE